LVPKFCTLSRS